MHGVHGSTELESGPVPEHDARSPAAAPRHLEPRHQARGLGARGAGVAEVEPSVRGDVADAGEGVDDEAAAGVPAERPFQP